MVLIEAMAFGVPCISFDCPSGPRDIIVDGSTGYLLEEGDVNGYVDALRLLATSSSLRAELGRNARYSVLKKFQRETVEAEFMERFNKAIRGGISD
jgi:glycosyltransferase involved in cell wall biosynthesis